MDITVLIVVMAVGGVLASTIAYSKSENGGTAIMFFLFGALLPLIGVIIACLVKRPVPPPMPPGWYPDPWAPDLVRWYDGATWTHHTNPAVTA